MRESLQHIWYMHNYIYYTYIPNVCHSRFNSILYLHRKNITICGDEINAVCDSLIVYSPVEIIYAHRGETLKTNYDFEIAGCKKEPYVYIADILLYCCRDRYNHPLAIQRKHQHYDPISHHVHTDLICSSVFFAIGRTVTHASSHAITMPDLFLCGAGCLGSLGDRVAS